jgi:hypothetical protein
MESKFREPLILGTVVQIEVTTRQFQSVKLTKQ